MSEENNGVPEKELRELAESWREERENRGPNTLSNVATLAKQECARELEALLDGD